MNARALLTGSDQSTNLREKKILICESQYAVENREFFLHFSKSYVFEFTDQKIPGKEKFLKIFKANDILCPMGTRKIKILLEPRRKYFYTSNVYL